MRALIISAIVLVAVIMGIGTIAPMMQYADAHPGKGPAREACAALLKIPNPSPVIEHLISHCCIPPACGGSPGSVEPKTF